MRDGVVQTLKLKGLAYHHPDYNLNLPGHELFRQ